MAANFFFKPWPIVSSHVGLHASPHVSRHASPHVYIYIYIEHPKTEGPCLFTVLVCFFFWGEDGYMAVPLLKDLTFKIQNE